MRCRLVIISNKIKEYQKRIGIRDFGNGDRCWDHHLNKIANRDLGEIQSERNFLASHGVNVSDIPDTDFWETAIAKLYDLRDKMMGNIFSTTISIFSFIISLIALIISICK